MDIFDLLLLPRKVYKKITAKKPTLFIGVLLVGILDMGFPIMDNFSKLFQGKDMMSLYYNITLAVVFTILLGFVDVLFFSIPVFDLFKYFRRQKDTPNNEETLIKVMKIYIVANFIILPINLLFQVGFIHFDLAGSFTSDLFNSFLILLPSAWLSAAVARGINEHYDFLPVLKRLVFPVVFAWATILGITLALLQDHWLMVLFK